MNTFETIDVLALDNVTGGAGDQPPVGQNTTSFGGNVGLTVPTEGGNVQAGVQFNGTRSTTNYGECVNTVRGMGGTVADIRQTCGLPGGGQ